LTARPPHSRCSEEKRVIVAWMMGTLSWPEVILPVRQAPSWQVNGHAKDVLFDGQYRKAKAKGECPNTKAAVLIDGKGAGSIFYLCLTEKCDVHNRVTRYQPTPQEQAQRKRVSGFVLANPEKSRKHLPSVLRT